MDMFVYVNFTQIDIHFMLKLILFKKKNEHINCPTSKWQLNIAYGGVDIDTQGHSIKTEFWTYYET